MPRISREGHLTLISVRNAESKVGPDLCYEGGKSLEQIVLEIARHGKVSGACLPRDDDGSFAVDGDGIRLIASVAAEVRPEQDGRQSRVHFDDESIHGPGVGSLEGPLGREVQRRGGARDVGVAVEVYCNAGDVVTQQSAKESGLQQCPLRSEMYDEPVGFASKGCLKSTGGDRKVGRACDTSGPDTAERVDGQCVDRFRRTDRTTGSPDIRAVYQRASV